MKYIYKHQNIPTHFIQTEKFKTNTLQIRFASDIDRSRITERVLLPSLLYAGSKKYNSKRKINLFMEELYDSSISFSMSKLGLSSVITISVSFVSDDFLDRPILNDIIEFVKEILLNPDIENNAFKKDKVDEEKRLLTEYFESIKDDKTEYAMKQLKHHMYEYEKFGISPIGYLEDLDDINGRSLYEEYQRMIQTDSVEVVLTGDFKDITFVNDFGFTKNYQVTILDKPRKINKVKKITETSTLHQAKINFGFRTPITHSHRLYYPMIVANAILGSAPNNLLFKKVREEHSLCYYIHSSFIPFNGAMYIYSGVNDSNIQKATKLIMEQIEILQEGRFDAELLVNTKKGLVSDMIESLDRQSAIAGRVYVYNQVGKVFDLDEVISKINEVVMEDVMEAANTIVLDTMYALSNEEDVWKE